MKSKTRFLLMLWAFVAADFLLYLNTTTDVVSQHNDLCKQGLDLNQSRISNLSSLQANLMASWPTNASSDPRPVLKSMATTLLDANQEIYKACVADSAVKESNTLALHELAALANPDTNKVWNKYLNIIEGAIAFLKAGSQ